MSFLNHFHTLCFETSCLIELEALAGIKPLGSSCLCSPVLVLQAHAAMPSFLLWFWGSELKSSFLSGQYCMH